MRLFRRQRGVELVAPRLATIPLPDPDVLQRHGQEVRFLAEAVPLTERDHLDTTAWTLVDGLVERWWPGVDDRSALRDGIAKAVNVGLAFVAEEMARPELAQAMTRGMTHPIVFSAMALAQMRVPRPEDAPEDFGINSAYAMRAGHYLGWHGPRALDVLFANAQDPRR